MNDLNDLLAACDDVDTKTLLEALEVSMAEDAVTGAAAIKRLAETLDCGGLSDDAMVEIAGAVIALADNGHDTSPLTAGWPAGLAAKAQGVAEELKAEGRKIGDAWLATDGFSTTSGGEQ